MPRQLGKSRRIKLLKSVWLFSLCTARERIEIADVVEQISVTGGSMLIRQHDVGTEFFIVVSGTASVNVDGRVVGDVGAGEFFGEMALLDGGPRSATVVAKESMELLVIDSRDLRALFGSSPGVAVKMLRVVGERLRAAHGRARLEAGTVTAP